MLTLEIIEGEARGQTFGVADRPSGIGRAATNAIVLPDYHLSAEHGQVFREDDQYLYRDLRSTNGSIVVRGDQRIVLEGGRSELPLRDGDRLLLGSPRSPVVLLCRLREDETLPATPSASARERVLAVKPLADLPAVTGRVEGDPAGARTLLSVFRKLGERLELGEVLEATSAAIFATVTAATHLVIQLASLELEEQPRFVPVLARERDGAIHSTTATAAAGGGEPIRTSRTVLRRVLRDRAAVLVADAAEELRSADSIMGARITSTMGVPLLEQGQVRGVVQIDNRSASGVFTERDLELVMVLAYQASLAIQNARLYERLRIAEERLRGENRYLRGREERRRFGQIIGESAAMKAIFAQLEKVIDTRATVCIEGETGTGKELVASAIHHLGKRRDKLFVAQNCAALPETLLESELFGHKRGAFTGADQEKKGLFEIAHGGTLFLDEIGDLPLGLQAKLLRVLQEGSVRPLGATAEKPVDVRILCATNRSLEKEVEQGRFREDLYYRLKVFPIRLPALRERREDIPLLAAHFLQKYSAELRKPIGGFSPEAMAALTAYGWPGNVRELENELQRLVIQADEGGLLAVEQLSPRLRKVETLLESVAPRRGTLKETIEEVERRLLADALREHGGSRTKAARALGITREGLHRKLSKLGIE